MPRGRITKRAVDALQCPSGRDRDFLWDDALAGFGVAAFPSGKKVYVAQFRKGGRSRRVAIGDHGRLTPDEARSQAKAILGSVETGADPIAERRAASGFATLIAFHLGGFKPGDEPLAHAYGRGLGYGEPRDLLEAMTRRVDEHIKRDAEARVRLFASVGVDLLLRRILMPRSRRWSASRRLCRRNSNQHCKSNLKHLSKALQRGDGAAVLY